jgi:hypothetical protein
LVLASGLFLASTAHALCLDTSALKDPSILEIQDKVGPRPESTIIYKYDISPCTNKPGKAMELTYKRAELTRIAYSWIGVSQEKCSITLGSDQFREAVKYVQNWGAKSQGPLSLSLFKVAGFLTLAEGSGRKDFVVSTDQPDFYNLQDLIDSIESKITEKDCSVIKYENTQPEF